MRKTKFFFLLLLVSVLASAQIFPATGNNGSGLTPISDQRILGNVSGSSAIPTALTAVQINNLLTMTFTRTSNIVITLTYPTGGLSFSNNHYVQTLTATQTITLSASSCSSGGIMYVSWNPATPGIQVDTNSNVTQGNVTLSGANIAFGSSTASGFIPDTKPIATLTCGTTAANQWDTSAITSARSAYSMSSYKAGAGFLRTGGANGLETFSPDTTTAGFATLTDGATITWAIGNVKDANAKVTLGGNRTLNITNPVNGGNYVLEIIQDSMGSRGLVLGTGCTWKIINGGAGAITPSAGSSAMDVLAFGYDGVNCVATFGKNFN